jgi:hypothetical protein
MFGRFDRLQKTTANREQINACGPINWGPGDAGKVITRIEVTFEQSGDTCKAHSPSGMTFRPGTDDRWAFQMSNNGMELGPVTATGLAKFQNGDEVSWTVQPNDPQNGVSIVAP